MASSPRIEELTKKFEENPRRYFAPLANEYRKTGDLEQAIALCRTHLPQQPGHMSGHVVYGQALFESGALDESKTVFETALQLDPENLIALRYLGDIALQQGDRDGARVWYHRVLDADPRNEEIHALIRTVDELPESPPADSGQAGGWDDADEGVAIQPDEAAHAEVDALLLDDFSAAGALGGETESETTVDALAGFEATSNQPTADLPMMDLDEVPEAAASSEPVSEWPERSEAELIEERVEQHDEEGFTLPVSPASEAPSPALSSISFDDEPGDSSPLQGGSTTAEDEPVQPSAGFVTETMAELYLRQGHRDAAIDVYRQLLAQSPGDAHFEARLAELERTGEPTIRSFLAGIASRRRRNEAFDEREAVPVPSGEWTASSSTHDTSELTGASVEVMGWNESRDVVAEVPLSGGGQSTLAAAADAGVLPGEISPALLDAVDELSTSSRASFSVDESAVPVDLPTAGGAAPASTPTGTQEPESLDTLFGNAPSSESDAAAATALAQAFAPVTESSPLAGRPAVPARDELSLDRVFRAEEDATAGSSGGFSFDQFFGSRTPHVGGATIPPASATPPSTQSSGNDADDIEQFNSWLQGLKKR